MFADEPVRASLHVSLRVHRRNCVVIPGESPHPQRPDDHDGGADNSEIETSATSSSMIRTRHRSVCYVARGPAEFAHHKYHTFHFSNITASPNHSSVFMTQVAPHLAQMMPSYAEDVLHAGHRRQSTITANVFLFGASGTDKDELFRSLARSTAESLIQQSMQYPVKRHHISTRSSKSDKHSHTSGEHAAGTSSRFLVRFSLVDMYHVWDVADLLDPKSIVHDVAGLRYVASVKQKNAQHDVSFRSSTSTAASNAQLPLSSTTTHSTHFSFVPKYSAISLHGESQRIIDAIDTADHLKIFEGYSSIVPHRSVASTSATTRKNHAIDREAHTSQATLIVSFEVVDSADGTVTGRFHLVRLADTDAANSRNKIGNELAALGATLKQVSVLSRRLQQQLQAADVTTTAVAAQLFAPIRESPALMFILDRCGFDLHRRSVSSVTSAVHSALRSFGALELVCCVDSAEEAYVHTLSACQFARRAINIAASSQTESAMEISSSRPIRSSSASRREGRAAASSSISQRGDSNTFLGAADQESRGKLLINSAESNRADAASSSSVFLQSAATSRIDDAVDDSRVLSAAGCDSSMEAAAFRQAMLRAHDVVVDVSSAESSGSSNDDRESDRRVQGLAVKSPTRRPSVVDVSTSSHFVLSPTTPPTPSENRAQHVSSSAPDGQTTSTSKVDFAFHTSHVVSSSKHVLQSINQRTGVSTHFHRQSDLFTITDASPVPHQNFASSALSRTAQQPPAGIGHPRDPLSWGKLRSVKTVEKRSTVKMEGNEEEGENILPADHHLHNARSPQKNPETHLIPGRSGSNSVDSTHQKEQTRAEFHREELRNVDTQQLSLSETGRNQLHSTEQLNEREGAGGGWAGRRPAGGWAGGVQPVQGQAAPCAHPGRPAPPHRAPTPPHGRHALLTATSCTPCSTPL